VERTCQTEKKNLTIGNQELRNTLRALKVSAAYIHQTAVLLGAVTVLCKRWEKFRQTQQW